MILVVITLVVAVIFWSVVELAAVVGFFGVLTGERIERCAHCRRYGLTSGGTLHEHGCPTGLREHLVHLAHAPLRWLQFTRKLHFGQH